MRSTLATLLLLSTPIQAGFSARIWTHFYPNCPGDTFGDMSAYENFRETSPSKDIPIGKCTNFAVPPNEYNLVQAVSIDGELISPQTGHPFPPGFGPRQDCNITLHEVPDCFDDPLITKKLQHGVEVSECSMRSFATYSNVWVKLVCSDSASSEPKSFDNQPIDTPRPDQADGTQQGSNVQTPGSNANSWHLAQTLSSEREPHQEERVENEGHLESSQVVAKIMEEIAHRKHGLNIVSGKPNFTSLINGTKLHNNGTAPGNHTISRRKLSVLRNRPTRLY
ncbi:hypothetical protein N7468_002407 [Penicillium chermesinum]|uniref:Uncharacterized protein n=1 Tax=Penicillium chermesinum TaxID=63820 RepID=A0A9W9PIP6_9EURO|nr:uncharacterized protein N7468_002407 [Penicillium chermesinum]KAJ5247424.1 hypothetical protein N7468_002407 [Penicillium chermesinum]KAJ6145663.1 hypothetical protein N7470_009558 [Penicillium chermesinum]